MTDSFSDTPSFHQRLATYEGWPGWAKQEPKTLARAGFRFRKERDLVKCDYCGGKFYNWKPEDDPVVEHMKYYPNCSHLARLLADPSDGNVPPPSESRRSRSPRRSADAVRSTATAQSGASSSQSRKQNGGRSAAESRPRSSRSHKRVAVPQVTNSDAKWLRSRMDLPFVQLVLRKGYKKSDVKKVLIANRMENKDVKDAVTLVSQIYDLEDKEKREPKAARNALESNPLVSSEGTEPVDHPAKSGDNAAVVGSEAKYCDPERDSRYRCTLPDEQQQAKARTGQKPRGPAAVGAAAPEAKDRNNGSTNRREAEDAVRVRSPAALCVVCKKTVQGCLFLPCNCLCCCPDCGVKVPQCPVCEKDIQHRLRVYLG